MPEVVLEAVKELKSLGSDGSEMEMEHRLPMVYAREKKLKESPRMVPISIGVMAHQFDDSECVLDQIKQAYNK